MFLMSFRELPCRPTEDEFRHKEGASHDRHPLTEHSPLTVLWAWNIRMNGDPGTREYGGQAAPYYAPY